MKKASTTRRKPKKADSEMTGLGEGNGMKNETDGTDRTERKVATIEGNASGQPRAENNPLLALEDKERARLFAWLRECPYDDAVQHLLRDQGIAEVSREQLSEFFQIEAEDHWEQRMKRAALEANALVQLAEKGAARFSSGILAALGQEAFRQIASGEVDPDAMAKITSLFMKARSDERTDQMQELKREKLRHELQGQIEHALEKLAEEVDKHPAARAAFEALQRELSAGAEAREEGV
jgi:predicted ribosome quality control (RQC) complex YloA/Tae2 family protein